MVGKVELLLESCLRDVVFWPYLQGFQVLYFCYVLTGLDVELKKGSVWETIKESLSL
jgi:hypothetical protein